ncbi:DUF1499 domain-containing protein [Jiella marina]|uniref:DUF1499 domain-containing protein n=1 Tax=Jiella sp. LLJ827 TaxID=2917712 RepID=UPI002100B903|nr:DUF1499 domain-containing protein [Jiella sp. LLJ827]MCQ0988273.1 DUF1499 domain-containing protein [Jiella sp. LLJ827]
MDNARSRSILAAKEEMILTRFRLSRRRPVRAVTTAMGSILVLGAIGFFLVGPERIWRWAAGPADQGPIDFDSLHRRATPNDALACSPGTCSEPVDLSLPFFFEDAGTLMDRLDRVVSDFESAERVDDGKNPAYRRYVFRSRVMRFPDTLDAQADEVAPGKTSLRLYSRALLGRSDLGANRKRLNRIAERLA